MRIERLGSLGSAADVLRAVADGARRQGLAPPAALAGDWFASRAVIAPTVRVVPVSPHDVFEVPPGGQTDIVGGGWIGYLSYPDAAADGAPARIPTAAGGWTECVLRLDHSDTWWYESLAGTRLPDWIVAALDDRPAKRHCDITWRSPDADLHRSAVLSCLAAIRAGDIYQACVCTQFVGTVGGCPLDFFADALDRTAPARAAYLAGDWGAVASLSPELFLRRRGDLVTSSPIKGTLPLDQPPESLRSSIKDVAENIMIVDLVRNDLSRVARTGSVSVPELLSVRRAPGVWHLVSTVSARVPAALPAAELIDATFPPASVTGTPKGRARQLLSSWEPQRRGVYCGAVGMASPLAGCELNVAIRTVEFDGAGNAVLGVGGGITADSDPAQEWQECLHKAAPIVGAAGVADRGYSEPPLSRPGARARSTAS